MQLPVFFAAGAYSSLEAERLLHGEPSHMRNIGIVVILMLAVFIVAWLFKKRR